MEPNADIRDVETIIEELHDLHDLIGHTRRTLDKFPHDSLLGLALKQDEFRKKQLLRELHLSLSLYLQAQ